MADGAPELALKLLMHLVGDMHQLLLHLSSRDCSRNEFKVNWGGRQSSACCLFSRNFFFAFLADRFAPNDQSDLHAVWDVSLIAKAISQTPAKYEKPIAAPALEALRPPHRLGGTGRRPAQRTLALVPPGRPCCSFPVR